jgi:8-oxo-dGTP pyrophosphatase MutT (NUDIX family)
MQKNTLLFLYKPETQQILLAMKKRGFGEGKWNGVGGKVEQGESIRAAAVREAQEEIGIAINPQYLEEPGVIHFSFEGRPDLERDVHVFFTEQWDGNPVETEEMRPQWYDSMALPYDKMWVDDKYWLPQVLHGKVVTAHFHLSASDEEILDMETFFR